jgi:hypothetical protein
VSASWAILHGVYSSLRKSSLLPVRISRSPRRAQVLNPPAGQQRHGEQATQGHYHRCLLRCYAMDHRTMQEIKCVQDNARTLLLAGWVGSSTNSGRLAQSKDTNQNALPRMHKGPSCSKSLHQSCLATTPHLSTVQRCSLACLLTKSRTSR